jgi:hypothetical protein
MPRFRTLFFDTFDKVRRIVTGIGNQQLEVSVFGKCRRLRNFITLATHQAKSQRLAEHMNAQVSLGRKATTTPA